MEWNGGMEWNDHAHRTHNDDLYLLCWDFDELAWCNILTCVATLTYTLSSAGHSNLMGQDRRGWKYRRLCSVTSWTESGYGGRMREGLEARLNSCLNSAKLNLRISGGWGSLVRLKLLDALGIFILHQLCYLLLYIVHCDYCTNYIHHSFHFYFFTVNLSLDQN